MNLWSRYETWILILVLVFVIAERLFPWRNQRLLRPQIGQDIFWLIFNTALLAPVLGPLFRYVNRAIDTLFIAITALPPSSVKLLASMPIVAQIILLMIITDACEWCVHNLLHRVPLLWRIHRLHHSITTMDWIGNMRFHWGEVIIYQTIKYLPLAILGASFKAALIAAIIAAAVGFCNHSNLKLSWGLFRFIFNSPEMHIWHHDRVLHGRAGTNFGIVFSVWDWIFGTAYMPSGQPMRLGFAGDASFPQDLPQRFFVPFFNKSVFTKKPGAK